MNVDVLLAEEVGINAVTLRVGTNPRQSRSHRLLHDFAEMARHRELLAAAHTRRLDEDDVAADWSPHQSDRDTGLLDAIFHFAFSAELGHAQGSVNDFGGDDQLLL